MPLFERKQQISRNGISRVEGKSEKMPPPKVEKKDTSIFGGKPYLRREEVVSKLKKSSPFIPGTGGKMYSEKEREGLAKEITKKWGSFLDKKSEVPKIFKELGKQKYQAKTSPEKLKIEREIRYLKERLLKK